MLMPNCPHDTNSFEAFGSWSFRGRTVYLHHLINATHANIGLGRLRPHLSNDRNPDLRRILLRVMHDVMRDHSMRFVIVPAAGVQVAIKAREVAAGNLQANAMAGLKEVARIHWLQRDLINLSGFEPGQRLVIAVT